MRAREQRVLLAALGLGLISCIAREDLDEIKKNQKDILAKLDTMSKAGPARPAPRAPQGPDASAVYSFPVDGSPSMGPADAWVTVVEVSDFQ